MSTLKVTNIQNPSSGTDDIQLDANGNVTIDNGTLFVDAVGNRVGIGTTSPGYPLDVNGAIRSDGTSGGLYFGGNSTTPSAGSAIHRPTNDTLAFVTASTERARIDSSGRLLVGTSSAQGQSIFQAVGNSSASTDPGDIRVIRGLNVSSIGTNVGAELGIIRFGALENSVCAQISAVCDANWSANDYPGRLVFSTTADGASSPTERMRINSNGSTNFSYDVRPTTSNAVDLGSSTLRWRTIYSVNALNTSDAKEKQQIDNLSTQELEVARNLLSSIKTFKYNFEVNTEGDAARVHAGIIAQDLEQHFANVGLDPNTYAMFRKDILDEGGEIRSVAYSEIYAFIIAALSNLVAAQEVRLETQATQLASIQARLTALETA